MYKCNCCGSGFDNYVKSIENGGEKWYRCPYCGETDFDELNIVLEVGKTEVAEKMLSVIARLNNFVVNWHIGDSITDLETSLGTLSDYVVGMIDGSQEFSDKLDGITTQAQAHELWEEFVGELQ